MSRMLHFGRTLALAAAYVALAAASPHSLTGQASPTARQQGAATPSIAGIAAQLGLNVQPQGQDDLGLGSSFTGTLKEPEKLGKFGIRNMHAGARVTVMRVAPDKLRVEADEMDPAPARGAATLRVDESGAAIVPKEAATPA